MTGERLSDLVHDPTGASISGATVTATEKATNVEITSKTNGSGEYIFNALKPGTYSVKAGMNGFSWQEFPNVLVEVQAGLLSTLRCK